MTLRRQALLSVGATFLVVFLGLYLVARGRLAMELLLVALPVIAIGLGLLVVRLVGRAEAERGRAEVVRPDLETRPRNIGTPEAGGRLAENVARDLNNVLFVITGRLALLSRTIGPASPQTFQIGLIRRAAERALSLTPELLTSEREQTLDGKELDLNALVTSMRERLGQLLGPRIAVRLVLDPALGRVGADPFQLEQVLLNAATNAGDAMPQGGSLTVETRNVDLDDGFVAGHHGAHAGPHVMLSITDTGVGMDAATCARAFEPFFTTRGLGRGAGLGLAAVYSIVKHFQGYTALESAPGRGTTLAIYLPRSKG
jgi:two-component system cell cycle sensor histidine kinase/response regulator CckA